MFLFEHETSNKAFVKFEVDKTCVEITSLLSGACSASPPTMVQVKYYELTVK